MIFIGAVKNPLGEVALLKPKTKGKKAKIRKLGVIDGRKGSIPTSGRSYMLMTDYELEDREEHGGQEELKNAIEVEEQSTVVTLENPVVADNNLKLLIEETKDICAVGTS